MNMNVHIGNSDLQLTGFLVKSSLFSGAPEGTEESFTDLRLVFSLMDYQAGPGTIVHSSRVLFLERVTHYESNVTCLSPRPENKCGGKIECQEANTCFVLKL